MWDYKRHRKEKDEAKIEVEDIGPNVPRASHTYQETAGQHR
jgi:hypothetical protein